MARSTNKSALSARSEITSREVPTTVSAMEKFLTTEGKFRDTYDLKASHRETDYEMGANDMGGISYKRWLSNQVERVIRNKKQEAYESKVFSTAEGKAIIEKKDKAYKEYSDKESKVAEARDNLYIKIKEATNNQGTPLQAFRDFVKGGNMTEGDAKIAKAFPKEHAELMKLSRERDKAKEISDKASEEYQELRRIK